MAPCCERVCESTTWKGLWGPVGIKNNLQLVTRKKMGPQIYNIKTLIDFARGPQISHAITIVAKNILAL